MVFHSQKIGRTTKRVLNVPMVAIGTFNTYTHNCIYYYTNGFYSYRGKPKSLLDKVEGEVYDRKIERSFEYF